MSKSLKFMLLGIAILLFTTAGSNLLDALIFPFVYHSHLSRMAIELIGSVVPVAGLVLVFVGFFTRD